MEQRTMNASSDKFELETPCLLVNFDVLMSNIKKMQALVEQNKKALRPHAKSHKCSRIAQLQMESGAIGICAAKLSEAEALARAGIKSILITGPVITESKMRRLIELSMKLESLIVAVDDKASLLSLNHLAAQYETRIDILVDIDIGLGRTGVSIDRAISFCNSLKALQHIRLRGIQAYAGQVQHLHSSNDRRNESLKCLETVFPILSNVPGNSSGNSIFSTGGTGTYFADVLVPKVTEIQPGSYVFMDSDYLTIEPPPLPREQQFNPALTLLTTVISVNRENWVVVDAGRRSLYESAERPFPIDNSMRHLKYEHFGDEYGKISAAPAELPKIGTVLEMVVSNCDPTVNLFDEIYVIKDDTVIDKWKLDLRGLSQ